jgi:hypothetical protein
MRPKRREEGRSIKEQSAVSTWLWDSGPLFGKPATPHGHSGMQTKVPPAYTGSIARHHHYRGTTPTTLAAGDEAGTKEEPVAPDGPESQRQCDRSHWRRIRSDIPRKRGARSSQEPRRTTHRSAQAMLLRSSKPVRDTSVALRNGHALATDRQAKWACDASARCNCQLSQPTSVAALRPSKEVIGPAARGPSCVSLQGLDMGRQKPNKKDSQTF